MMASGKVDHMSSVRLIADVEELVDNLLPEDYEISLDEDGSDLYVELPENDEVAGILAYTNSREKGDSYGPDFKLTLVYAGSQEDEISTWFSLEQALQHFINRCEPEED